MNLTRAFNKSWGNRSHIYCRSGILKRTTKQKMTIFYIGLILKHYLAKKQRLIYNHKMIL
jgi:hypothetical protein